MSLITWIVSLSSKRQDRRRCRRRSTRRKRTLNFYGRGIECLELRDMLSGVPVVIDWSADPVHDAIDVSTSGTNTVVSVDGKNVYTGASSAISSLSIIGSHYGNMISFDYTSGNPVPDGTISVKADSGDNVSQLSVTADADLYIYDTEIDLSRINNSVDSSVIGIQGINEVTQSGNADDMAVDGFVGIVSLAPSNAATVRLYALPDEENNTFWGALGQWNLEGPGYNYAVTAARGSIYALTNGGTGTASLDGDPSVPTDATLLGSTGYIRSSDQYVEADSFATITATSENSADAATLGDPGWGGSDNAYMHPTSSYFQGNGYTDTVNGYQSVTINASYSTDDAFLDDSGSGGVAGTHPLSCSFIGISFNNVANNFGNVQLTSYNTGDVANMDDNGATGASNFFSFPSNSYWSGTGYVDNAVGFKTINSVAYNVNDYAWYTDNVGSAILYVNNGVAMDYGNGTAVTVYDFGGYENPHVSANAALPAGQYDAAASALKAYVVFYGNWIYVS